VNFTTVAWFPDGKHVLLEASKEGEPLRTYEMDLQGGKPQEVGPADLTGVAVAKDGQKIAGRNSAGEAVVFNRETKKVQIDSGHWPTGRHRKMDQRRPSTSGNDFDSMGSAGISSGSVHGKEELAAESGIERKGRIDIQREGAVRRGRQDLCV
jgi:Tol biopolymer transport system component